MEKVASNIATAEIIFIMHLHKINLSFPKEVTQMSGTLTLAAPERSSEKVTA
jgi:hypothetical protein